MMQFYKRLRLIISLAFDRDAANLFTLPGFASANKKLLIIVADPETDRVFVTYRDKFVNGKIKTATGKEMKIVKDVLSHSRFPSAIDDFIAALVNTLNVPLTGKTNQFYRMIDAAIFNIAKSLRDDRHPEKKVEARPQVPQPGAIPSPFAEGIIK